MSEDLILFTIDSCFALLARQIRETHSIASKKALLAFAISCAFSLVSTKYFSNFSDYKTVAIRWKLLSSARGSYRIVYCNGFKRINI